MTLRAFSCKGGLIRKYLSQYWMLALGLLVIMITQSSPLIDAVTSYTYVELSSEWRYLLEYYTYTFLELLASVVMGILLFSYLHNKKKNCFFHSLPGTRDDLFLSSYVSGLLLYAIPWLLTTAITAVTVLCTRGTGLWLTTFLELSLYRLCMYITFFGYMSLSMVLCGRAFFGVLTALFLATFIPLSETLLFLIAEYFLYGVNLLVETYTDFLSPFYLLVSKYDQTIPLSTILAQGGAYAVASVLLSYIALRLHRIRKEEKVEESLVFSPMFSVLLVFTTFIFSLILSSLVALIFSSISLYIILPFSIPAFFLARMFLLRSKKVFQKKALIGCGIYVLVLSAILLSFQFDIFGITKKLPEGEEVQSVSVSYNGMSFSSENPQNIENAISLHSGVIDRMDALQEEADDSDYGYSYLRITYTKKNGRTIERDYYLRDDDLGSVSLLMEEDIYTFFRQEAQVHEQLQMLKDTTETATISAVADKNSITLSTLQQNEFFRLLEEDLNRGIDPFFLYFPYTEGKAVSLVVRNKDDRWYDSIYIPDEATSTLAFLEAIEKGLSD